MLKKSTALLLALLMVAFSAVACSQTSESGNETEKPSDSVNTETNVTENEETEDPLYTNLPTEDYGGYNFRVMTAYSNYAITDFDFDSLTGEIINDTIYDRNRFVEDKLNIKISNTKGTGYNSVQDELAIITKSGDDVYDIMFSEAGISAKSSANGYMLNLYDIPGVDYTNPWWEQNSLKYYDIKGKLYFTHSPMHLHYYESLVTILFNKSIVKDNGIEDLYNTVKDGKWTLDKMSELSGSIAKDVNGDNIMNAKDDIFGVSISTNLLCYFTLGAGSRFTDKNDADEIVYNGISEKMVNITEKLSSVFADKNQYIDSNTPGVSEYALGYISAFNEGKSLFYVDVLGRVKEMRTMDADFGILPMPKYDEEQADYISANYNGAAIMFVPSSNTNYENIGTILENLGAYSYRDLIPSYYEINIRGKQIRDEQSAEMLEIMLGNITFDLGLTFSIADMNGTYTTIVTGGKSVETMFAKLEKIINANITKMMDSYQ